jgi:hypothetical protein
MRNKEGEERKGKMALSKVSKFKLSVLMGMLVLAVVPLALTAAGAQAVKSTTDPRLNGAYRIDENGWIYVHLQGDPYQIGFQNGYLTWDNLNESWNAWLYIDYNNGPQYGYTINYTLWDEVEAVCWKYIWPLTPSFLQQEMEGIAAGAEARGLKWTVKDVLAFNSWADLDPYYWNGTIDCALHNVKKGCSAFIATGSYTTDGKIVIGHETWSSYADNGEYNVLYDIKPTRGYEMIYQSTGGMVWSGEDWIYNSAGLMVVETTLPMLTEYNPNGLPVFARERLAMEFGKSINDFIRIMTTDNSGAYSNEWLIGDAKTGEICSLQLGTYNWDIERTFNGFIGSCNCPKGLNISIEEGLTAVPPPSPRLVRWNQLIEYYTANPHLIDCSVGMEMLADHYDTVHHEYIPDDNTLDGRWETDVFGQTPYPGGSYDGKVTCSNLVLGNMGMWARWGHPSGDPFNATDFVAANPSYAWQLPYLHNIPLSGMPEPWTYFSGAGPCTRSNL